MALRNFVVAPSYREASIAAGAERQQYGTDSGRETGGVPMQPRFNAHEREAHLEHAPRMGDPRSPERAFANARDARLGRATGDAPRHGARSTAELSDAERRMLAGLDSNRSRTVAEVARKAKETAVDIPSQVGIPMPAGKELLDALKKYGGQGGGDKGGPLGEFGAIFGDLFDMGDMGQYGPKRKGIGPAGSSYIPGQSGGGTGGDGGFGDDSSYFPQGHGDAMDPKSPSGRSLGARAPRSGGGVPTWNPRGPSVDMSGEGYGTGYRGLPGTRPDALFRARTWRAFNPGGGVTEDPKPKDEKPKEEKPKDATPPTASVAPYHAPKTPEERVIYRTTLGAVVGGIVAASLGRTVPGVVAGVIAGGVLGAGIGILQEKEREKNGPPRSRPADDGNSPTGPRSNTLLPADDGTSPTGPRTSILLPSDEGNSPTGPRSNSLRPADDGNSPTGPRINIFRPSDEGGPVGPNLRQIRQKPT